jgi:hypothetical protein
MHFAFTELDWPKATVRVPLSRIAPVAALLVLLVAAQIVPFLW